MEEIQIWQKEGCGTDSSTLRKVIEEFRTYGVENASSAFTLRTYLEGLDRRALLCMYSFDDEVTLQMLVDYLGIKEAFRRCCAATAMLVPDTGRLAAAETELENRRQTIEELTEKVRSQNDEIVTLKAKLYDTYEGKYNSMGNQKLKETTVNGM